MNKTKKMVCAPIAALTLIGSLIGGANAALVSWTIDTAATASATMTNGTGVTATLSGPGTFFALSQSTDPGWGDEFGNSFFADPGSGNGLVVADAQGTSITFTFGIPTSGVESWYSNAVADFTYDTAISSIDLQEASLAGMAITNTAPEGASPPTGPGNPSQSAGMLSLDGSVSSFTIAASVEGVQEGIIYGITNVPEPSSTLLLGLGGLGLAFRRSRR